MVKASVMEIYDLQTQVGKGTVLKVHTPTGNNIKRHLLGHFLQYKQFKYLGAKLSLVPASTLPVDPTGLSYEAGDTTVDPRDMVNPILWKHYHGESMLTDALYDEELKNYNSINDNPYEFNGSAVGRELYNVAGSGTIDAVYPKALMDVSFKKAGIQTGFSTFIKPFVYNVVNARQMLPYTDTTASAWAFSGVNPAASPSVANPVRGNNNGDLAGSYENEYNANGSVNFDSNFVPEMFTNRLTPLGWMDTVQRIHKNVSGGEASAIGPDVLSSTIYGQISLQPFLPNIPMLYIMMPPAYKTEFYFRLIIKHYFAFKGFRSAFSVDAPSSAGIVNNIPAQATTSTSAAVASMVLDLDEDGTDTIAVENGELRTMADGASES
uniref:Capsid protein n=1 Tax=Porcine associated porprismacovirus TaxID=2496634 RepID=A0A515J4M3_9VIRU|nr:capsid protein [Porcine associated porprismacovirus]QDM14436.1 capsid protein [Porcine associated porprismacovirus]